MSTLTLPKRYRPWNKLRAADKKPYLEQAREMGCSDDEIHLTAKDLYEKKHKPKRNF